ncbi:MAG: F0F1 ATP synthase subunit A [Actinomycetaceae bacterium]|nr:F0F1 ATP synthase subunit A [Actinomycetaceae bacterium]
MVLQAHAVSQMFMPMDHEFHAPSLEDFFPPSFAFVGTPFEINRLMLVRLIVLVVFTIMFTLYVRRAKLVPGRAQATLEFLLDFVKTNVSEQMLGRTMATKYNGVVAIVFFTALFMNLAGIVPGLNIAGTAVAGLPLVMALFSYIAFVYAGIREQGFGKYFKASLFPAGVPWYMYFLLTPIEAFSTFVSRPFSLFIRLLANMIAGHFLLALCLASTNFFILYVAGPMKALGALTFISAIFMTLFEMLVAFLQAYIFAMLTAAYIDLSVHSH